MDSTIRAKQNQTQASNTSVCGFFTVNTQSVSILTWSNYGSNARTAYITKTKQHEVQTYDYFIGYPDSKVHGANMEPIWGRHDPGGPHVGPMNLAIWKLHYKYQ